MKTGGLLTGRPHVGRRLLSHLPLRIVELLGRAAPPLAPHLDALVDLRGRTCPFSWFKSGFGSNVSMWLGPPA
jgi:hypothetical protein